MPWRESLFEKHFKGNEHSLPCWQHPITCKYSEPDKSNHIVPFWFFKIHFNNIFPATHMPSKWSPLGFHTKSLRAFLFFPTCATCSARCILFDLSIQLIFYKEYKSYSFSLCSLILFPLTFSLSLRH